MAKSSERDIGLAYCAIGALELAAAFFPIPVALHMIPLTLLIIYAGSQLTVVTSEGGEKKVVRIVTKLPLISNLALRFQL